MKNRSFRRWLTLVLVLAMLIGVLPAAVAADASLSDEKPTGTKYDIASWALDGTTNIALNKKVSVSSDYVAPEGIWGSTLLTDGYVRGVVGYGGAEKKQVMEMTKSILHLTKLPRPDDAADALALAICHGHSRQAMRYEGLL